MALNHISSEPMPLMHAVPSSYTMTAHLVHQMNVPQANLPSRRELAGHLHPVTLRSQNPEASLHQSFTPYDLANCTSASSFSMMNRPIVPHPDLCMYPTQSGFEMHTSQTMYMYDNSPQSHSFQNCFLPSQSFTEVQESKLKKQAEQSWPCAFQIWSPEQIQSSGEKPADRGADVQQHSSQEYSSSSKRKKNKTDGIKTKVRKKARFVKDGCSNACQRRCKQKISQETRNELFVEFWGLETDVQRKAFVAHHAVKLPMMTCKEGSKRSVSVDWAFTVKGESFSVCKRFFLHTLDVPEELAYSAIKESGNSYESTPVRIKPQIKKKNSICSGWIETDIDDYSARKAEHDASKGDRYERKERITEMKPGCTKSCRRHCQSKFTYDQRQAIFNGYRCLSNVRKQREFLRTHVQRLERKDIKKKSGSRRGCSIHWLLDLDNESIPVCKTFFLHTVGISEHTAYSIGLQNDLLPVKQNRSIKKPKAPTWILLKIKYMKTMFAKGKASPLLARLGNKDSSLLGESSKKSASHCSITTPRSNTAHNNNTLSTAYDSKTSLSLQMPPTLNEPSQDFSPNISHHPVHQFLHAGICIRPESQTSGPGALLKSPNTFELSSHKESINQTQVTDHSNQTSLPSVLSQNLNFMNSQYVLPSEKDRHLFSAGETDVILPKTSVQDELTNSQQGESAGRMHRSKRYIKRDPRERAIGKQLKSGCSDLCRRKCNQKIPHSVREELFREFWKLESDTLRREFILPIVNKIPKKSGKHSESRRNCTLQWTIPCNGEIIVVCKKFFLDTFDIRDNFVHTVHDKIERNEGSMEDMRGRNRKRPAAFILEEREVENFMKSRATYKAVRCFSCQKDFPRWCLDSKLPLGQLYKDYVEQRKASGGKPACRTSFSSICVKKLNIKHSTVQENICDMCKDLTLAFDGTKKKN